jgi:hypothetical protein
MCFSATANFAGAAVLGSIGVATIAEVRSRRELLLAAMPCLFALHQLIEGFVWLGLDHNLSAEVIHNAAAAYVLFAQGLLPFLLPLSVLLIEPTPFRQRRMFGFFALGSLLGMYTLWGLIAYPLQTYALNHTIVYQNDITTTTTVAVLYVIATCGALFFSGFRDLFILGSVNLVGLIAVMLIRRYAFTSVWCAYAAVVSVIIYFFFRRNHNERHTRQLLVHNSM